MNKNGKKSDLVGRYIEALDLCYSKPGDDECFETIIGILRKMKKGHRASAIISTLKSHKSRLDAEAEWHVLEKILERCESIISPKDWTRINQTAEELGYREKAA